MNKLSVIKDYARTLKLKNTHDQLEALIHSAEQSDMTYFAFIEMIFKEEIKYKQDRAKDKRVKEAGFPYIKYLDDFDLNFCDSLSIKQFNQLKELTWIDGLYNLILAGPPGTGKTHTALGLAYHACDEGYKVSYTSMQALVQCLRTEEIDRRSKVKMNRIRKSHLLVIDEVGYLPISSIEGNLFFQLISELQEQTSIIITTNKGFEEWTEFLGDAALATAILDRLSYRCDRIQMSGKSYRLENRKSFLITRRSKIEFNKSVSQELKDILISDFKKYENNMVLTETEKLELQKWLSDGYSPYSNPNYVSTENGSSMDFVTATRISAELEETKLEELGRFIEIQEEINDLKKENQALRSYIEDLQSMLKTKKIDYPEFIMPDEIPF